MKRRILCLAVVGCLLLSLCSAVSANPLAEEPTEMEGVSVTTENFKDIFSGNPNARTAYAPNALGDSELTISNVSINDGIVTLTLTIPGNNGTVTLPITGKLSASYKTQNNVNSAIIEVPEAVNGYEVLLFEIFNDTSYDTLLLNTVDVGSDLDGVPHIKVYLKDAQDNMYLYEEAMPDVFANINAFAYDRAAKERDGLWAISYVSTSPQMLTTNDEMLQFLGLSANTRALNAYSEWHNPETCYDSYYLGNDLYQHYSLLYVRYKHMNVSNDTTWESEVLISERSTLTSLYQGKTYTYYGTNVYQYYDPVIAFACGDRTTFIETVRQGRIYDYSGFFPGIREQGQKISINLLEKSANASLTGSIYLNLVAILRNLLDYDRVNNVTLTSDSISLTSGITTAVGVHLEGYYLDECTNYNGLTNNGHYFLYDVTAQSEGAYSPVNTTGALLVEFDVHYNGDDSFTHVYQSFELNYTAAPT